MKNKANLVLKYTKTRQDIVNRIRHDFEGIERPGILIREVLNHIDVTLKCENQTDLWCKAEQELGRVIPKKDLYYERVYEEYLNTFIKLVGELLRTLKPDSTGNIDYINQFNKIYENHRRID